MYQDEVHFQLTTTITRKWVVKGSKPTVKSAAGKSNVTYSGFVIPKTGELFVSKPQWFNYESTIEAFGEFVDRRATNNKKICLVIDNAPWHKKAKRLIESDEKYKKIREKIDIVFLPAYSPDLNPIELCWRKTRREATHNKYFKNREILEETLDEFFKKYEEPNDELVSLCCFKHKY